MNFTSIADRSWDVLVVGAGPAGAMAALLLAQQGRRVLLIDHSPFPREKVCGCCLGARGVQRCNELGVGHVLDGGVPIDAMHLRNSGQTVRLKLPRGVGISRGEFDNRLVGVAIGRGAVFIDSCSARLSNCDREYRRVHLTCHGKQAEVRASLVLACDGIQGRLLEDEPGCAWQIAPDAWIGAATTLAESSDFCPHGAICMHVSDDGYVGAVRLHDGGLHLAAALSRRRLSEFRRPELLIRAILQEACGLDLPALAICKFLGTPQLTRFRRMLGSQRVLAVGDACGYVEPFTGEGMTWAIESAQAIAEFIPASLLAWPEDMAQQWTRHHQKRLGQSRRLCQILRSVVHRPKMCRSLMRLLGIFPQVGQMAIRQLEPADGIVL